MKKIDYHIHSSFSADSQASIEEYIHEAILRDLDEICFTDHYDINYPEMEFILDIPSYFTELTQLKEKYQSKINIKIGIEIGLDPNYKSEIVNIINSYPFDFVIGSIHVINNTEFIHPGDYFKGKSKIEAHKEYFDHVLKCVQLFDCFDVLGHLDYIERYGPYESNKINERLFTPLIDEILRTLISKNKGIEVNTSGFLLMERQFAFPSLAITQRYYDLGGKVITIGTDSHDKKRIGENVDRIMELLQNIGFKEVSTYTKRKIDS